MNTENAVREVVILAVGEIPEAGGIIAGLVGILWPESQEDIWGQIKDKVEALINKKLADYEYQQVQEDLAGLHNVLKDYGHALQHSQSNLTFISEKYNVALGQFEASQPHFMSKGYEVLLLPLLAQMANLHLALLQDGVNYGSSWGWTPETVTDMKTMLTESIKSYGDWVTKWYRTGYDEVRIPQSGKHLRTIQWAARNKYVRGMTLQVLDIAFYWPYFDPAKQNGSVPKLTREIYSDPRGTADDNPIDIDVAAKTSLTELSIWGWDRIDAVQQGFGGGALGPRMGNERRSDGRGGWSGGSNKPPHGWTGSISTDNPVVEVNGPSGDIVNSMRLKFKNGNQTNLCDGNYPGGSSFAWSFDGEILSRIYISGPSRFYGSAECVIFGFRFADSY